MVNATTETTETTCLNCGRASVAEGDFCPYCGQPRSVGRLGMKSLSMTLLTGLSRVDKGFIFTCVMLLTRPWRLIKDYIDGKRQRFTGPVQTLIILCFLSLVIDTLTGAEQSSATLDGVVDTAGAGAMGAWLISALEWYMSSPLVLNLTVFFPAVPAFRRITRFRGRHVYNLAECLTAAIYASGALLLFGLVTTPLEYVADNLSGPVNLLYAVAIGAIGAYKAIGGLPVTPFRKAIRIAGFFALTILYYLIIFIALGVIVALAAPH